MVSLRVDAAVLGRRVSGWFVRGVVKEGRGMFAGRRGLTCRLSLITGFVQPPGFRCLRAMTRASGICGHLGSWVRC